MATTDIYHVTGALTPARRAARFLGGNVDDYVQVNAFAVARVAADDAVGTFSAWVNVPDKGAATYCIIGCGDDNAVEFIEFNIETAKLGCRCTDGATVQFVGVTDNQVIKPHTWQHLAVVQAADGAGPKFYVDGVRVASTNTTTTDVNEWFVNCDGIDTARIGAANKAGDASVTNEFKGGISDLKYWSAALTDEEILKDYQGIAVQTAALQSHWDMNDGYVDLGLGADNGTVVGDIVLNNGYCEFTSRLGFMTGTPLVADSINFAVNNNQGHCVLVQAA